MFMFRRTQQNKLAQSLASLVIHMVAARSSLDWTVTGLVAVNQSDEKKQGAERDGPGEDGFDQQHCPTAQQEDVDEQPEHRKSC